MKHQEMAKKILEPVEEYLAELVEDLKACHEYYCKYNCGTLLVPDEHTSRCRYLQGVYGFPPQKGPNSRVSDTKEAT